MLAWLAWPLVLFSPTLKKKKNMPEDIKLKKTCQHLPLSLGPGSGDPQSRFKLHSEAELSS